MIRANVFQGYEWQFCEPSHQDCQGVVDDVTWS